MSDEPTTHSTPLQHLQATLEAALDLMREMTADQLLARLLAVFRSMPAEDRPVLIDALEREVKARKLSLATADVSGQSMAPNPHARLYLRVHESAFDRNVLERDEMMIATVRGMRAATLIPAIPEIYASWRDATREAMQHVDEPTRAVTEGLVQEVLGFIAAARAAESEGETPEPVTADATAQDARES
jgi:hypothetical protein